MDGLCLLEDNGVVALILSSFSTIKGDEPKSREDSLVGSPGGTGTASSIVQMKKKLSKENISKKKLKTKSKKEKEGTQTVHWQKGALLGKGAFGSVFEAMTDTGEMMAVKQIVLPPSLNMAPSITGAAPVRCPHTHTRAHTHTHPRP